MTNTPEHLHIPYNKTKWAYIETIFEICLTLTPILLITLDGKNVMATLIIVLPLCIWGIIPPLLTWLFLLSTVPIMTLTKKGVHFYYPFQIGFINWMDFEGIATQKTHWKHFYRFTFQTPKTIASNMPFFKRLLFHRIYRKNDLFIPQDLFALTQKEFFQAIQDYSNVAPDNVDI